MRRILLLFLGGMFLFFSSCKKCMNCTSVNKATGKTVDTYPEICGKKKSLDTQELTYRMTLSDSLELDCPRGKD